VLFLGDFTNVFGKDFLVRLDYNVPVKNGIVLDDARLRSGLRTIKFILSNGGRVIIASHFGRPHGFDESLSLKFLLPILSSIFSSDSIDYGDCLCFSPEINIDSVKKTWAANEGSKIMMLENLRFYAGEELDEQSFAENLASLSDFYVNDAFSVSHRAHASVHKITKLLPSFIGFALMDELSALSRSILRPERPVLGIVGGAKVSTKFHILTGLAKKLDHLFIGGAMAHTFLHAKGWHLGASLFEPDLSEKAMSFLDYAESFGCTVHLPIDLVGTDLDRDHVKYFDVGVRTIGLLRNLIDDIKTVIWNGPLGMFEEPPYETASFAIARYIAKQTRSGKCFSLAGGGETGAMLSASGVFNDFSYVSNAGGAFLEFIEGKSLPGLDFTAT
jgi:phosphoglycerate kinase